MKKNRFLKPLAILLAAVMVFSLAACGGSSAPAADDSGSAAEEASGAGEAARPEGNVIRVAESFAYPSLDVHKEYYGWYTQIYGMSEALFRMDENSVAQPLLAEGASVDGNVWTVTLRDGICFSNGEAVTADMVVRNLERAAAENERFAFLNDFEIAAADDSTVTITTPEVYPTLLNDLASPELGIMDLDNTEDFDNAPICTGPFVIDTFVPEGDVTVARNDNYWGGDVQLDGAVFYYMPEDDPKLYAMQGGEIDGYTSVTATALEIYEAEPDRYEVTSIPATRLQFYGLNGNRLDESVREAINMIIDKDAIAEFLNGTISAAVGPFSTAAAYGQVTGPVVDVAAAQALLEADGYTLNADGFYEKDGQPLRLNICYYAARSLDTLAVLMQEQLQAAGIDAYLTVEEDPDGTYLTTGDFDIALYCMIADKAGDPYYCVDALFRQDSRWAPLTGFHDDEVEALIEELRFETDAAHRAELANQIVQTVIDANYFGFVGLFNKITVLAPGVSGLSENCPFDFYGIDANTTLG